MKNAMRCIFALMLCVTLTAALASCDIIANLTGGKPSDECVHADADGNEICDLCGESVGTGGGGESGDTHGTGCTHTPASAVRENEVGATCYSEGGYDEVVYCSRPDCGAEISRTHKTTDKLAHTPSGWITDVEPTCAAEGERHIECTVCDETLESERISKLTAHTPASEAVVENERAGSCTVGASYDEVVYCSISGCGAEISRKTVALDPKHSYVGYSCTVCKALRPHSSGLEFSTNTDGTATVVGMGYCTDTELVIPPVDYQGNIVTAIRFGAFSYEKIKSVAIPEGVKEIGNGAFDSCTALEEIYFGAAEMNDVDTSTYIFENAGLSSDGIRVIIGNKVKSIPAYLFNSYGGTVHEPPKLISVEFEKDSICTGIGRYAFRNCSTLDSFHIPPSLESIGSYAFSGCGSIDSVYIEDLAAWCGISLWYGNHEYTNPLAGASKLYLTAGGEAELVTELVIPEGVEAIADNAFYGAPISSVVIPEGVTSIGHRAFMDCKALTSVSIGSGVGYIGSYTFYNCTALESASLAISEGWQYTKSGVLTDIPESELSDAAAAADALTDTYKSYAITRAAE